MAEPGAKGAGVSDFKLDSSDDIELVNGSPSIVTGPDAVIQNIRVVLRIFVGDWFQDSAVGIDYYSLFEKPADELRFRTAIVRAIRTVAGVVGVERIQARLGRDRVIAVTGQVRMASGDLVGLDYREPIGGAV